MVFARIRKAVSLKECGRIFSSKGFTILEILISLVVFSIALLALSSVSLTVIGGNQTDKNFIEAVILGQSTLETLRNSTFNSGTDTVFPSADDDIAATLINCTTSNDATTEAASLFANPDHGYTVDADGNETALATCSSLSSLTPQRYLRRTWSIRDNSPVTGMKTISVVVGWREGVSSDYFIELKTAVQGE